MEPLTFRRFCAFASLIIAQKRLHSSGPLMWALYESVSMKKLNSRDIALEQLETALRLYKESQEYVAVITLAGAAEEILGKACREAGIKTALEDLQHGFYLIRKIRFGNTADDEKQKSDKYLADRANFARNKVKHVNPVLEPVVEFNPKEEAHDMLSRALDNWWALGLPYSKAMLDFHNNERGSV